MGFTTRVKENIAYFRAALDRFGMSRGDRAFCRADMAACVLLHGCTPKNYIWFRFDRLNHHESASSSPMPARCAYIRRQTGRAT